MLVRMTFSIINFHKARNKKLKNNNFLRGVTVGNTIALHNDLTLRNLFTVDQAVENYAPSVNEPKNTTSAPTFGACLRSAPVSNWWY